MCIMQSIYKVFVAYDKHDGYMARCKLSQLIINQISEICKLLSIMGMVKKRHTCKSTMWRNAIIHHG